MSDSPAASMRLWLVLFAGTLVQVLATFASLTIAAIAPAVSDGVGVPVEFIGFQVAVIYTGASSSSGAGGRRASVRSASVCAGAAWPCRRCR